MARVRKIRSEHGTRVARTIVCRNCGKKDTLTFSPKDPTRALCRKCAVELLGVEDEDVIAERKLTCTECGRIRETTWDEESTFVCKDCFAGIHTKQGDKSKGAARVKKNVLKKKK